MSPYWLNLAGLSLAEGKPSLIVYLHPCFSQKALAASAESNDIPALPTFSRGSAVLVHPIKGLTHFCCVANSMRQLAPFPSPPGVLVWDMPCWEGVREGLKMTT